ncbi:hypothetical protein A2U01_0112170, partial [Trifolium medium]|nr:hypothetical protein [Trifolium medium]
ASSGSSPLPIAVAGDQTVVLHTKFSVNHHYTTLPRYGYGTGTWYGYW